MPRSGRFQGFIQPGWGVRATHPPRGEVKSTLQPFAAALALAGALAVLGRGGDVTLLERDFAAARSLARVLPGSGLVLGGLAAAQALAAVLSGALVLGLGGGTRTLALAIVLGVGALALTRVQALADVGVLLCRGRRGRRVCKDPG